MDNKVAFSLLGAGALIGALAINALSVDDASAKDVVITIKGSSALAISGRWEALADGGVTIIETYSVKDSNGKEAPVSAQFVQCEAAQLVRGACLGSYNKVNGF